MLDARNIYRKVTRKIYDFSPEQLQNLTAIVWLYRGKTDRFLALVEQYLESVSPECAAIPEKLGRFEDVLGTLRGHLEAFRKHIEAGNMGDAEKRRSLIEAMSELGDASDLYEQDRSSLVAGIETFRQSVGTNLLATNDQQHTARQAFDPIAEKIKGLIKQVDLLYKLASRATELAEGQGERHDRLRPPRRSPGLSSNSTRHVKTPSSNSSRRPIFTDRSSGCRTAFPRRNWPMCRAWSSSWTVRRSKPLTGA